MVAQLHAHNEELLFSSKKQTVGSGAVSDRGPRRFCSTIRRGCRAVDVRYAKCDSSRECPRIGEVVRSWGLTKEFVTDIAAFSGRKRGQWSLRDTVDKVQQSAK